MRLHYFLVGFLIHSVLIRLFGEKPNTDIGYPLGILALILVATSIRELSK